jgi:hypothetical protein
MMLPKEPISLDSFNALHALKKGCEDAGVQFHYQDAGCSVWVRQDKAGYCVIAGEKGNYTTFEGKKGIIRVFR